MDVRSNTHRVRLGQGDLEIAPLGVGTWSWGGRFAWGYGREYSADDVRGAFEASVAAGIDFFDTAELYGRGESERLLGQFVQANEQPAVVATKFATYPWRLGKGSLLRALRGSLKRLGTGQVDLYQIHWPLPPVPIVTWMEGLADAVEAGLTRAVGVSNYSLAQMQRAYQALDRRGIPLTSNQVEYSLLHRDPERSGLLWACQELGVTLIAYSPLAMGVLTGKYTPDHPLSGFRSRRFGPENLARVQPLVMRLREIGQAHDGKTPAQVALNWVMAKGAVPIAGAKNADQARQNAGAMGWRLAEDEVAALDAASDQAGA